MSAPSEPEKYSIDEMMERLQGAPKDNVGMAGELVTRADGSQAIRVRKRKRRSEQPQRDERQHVRRSRIIQVSVALILLFLTVLITGSAIVYSNSQVFREQLLQKIAFSSGAMAQLDQYRMTPSSAHAGRLILTWPAGNALHTLTLHNLKADVALSSFLGQSLTGEDLAAAEGTLILQVPHPDKPLRYTPAIAESLPIQFNRYAIPKVQVLLGEPTAPMLRMQNSEGTFYPGKAPASTQLLLNRGDITIAGWPKLRMDRAHIEFRGSEVEVVSMRLRHATDNRGVLELTGTVAPYATARSSTLTIRCESYLLSGIVGPELGRLCAGRIDTLSDDPANVLALTPAPNPKASLAMAFRNSPTSSFELNGFTFLLDLAQTMGDDWFERPVFDGDISGILRRAAGNVTISDLNCANKGRMALRGSLTMAPDQRLTGNLEVGIASALLKSATNRRLSTLFSPGRDGFCWLTVKIGGTAAAPTDNFKELLAISRTAPPTPPSDAIPTFEELTKPH